MNTEKNGVTSFLSLHHGRGDRIRTCGILLPKQARYHLRYTSIFYFLSLSKFPCFARPLAVPGISFLSLSLE